MQYMQLAPLYMTYIFGTLFMPALMVYLICLYLAYSSTSILISVGYSILLLNTNLMAMYINKILRKGSDSASDTKKHLIRLQLFITQLLIVVMSTALYYAETALAG